MKTNKENKSSYIFLLIFALLAFQSCTKEDDNQVKAVFSYVSDGFAVNFTNFSVGATQYQWDFGDGTTSTLRSPAHIFKSTGSFEIKLTAIQGDITNEFTDSIYIEGPNIKIDGNFTDWEHVPFIEDRADGEIVKVKVYGVGDALNFYIEGTDKFSMPVVQLYFDTDNNPATGFYHWMYPVASGAEFLIEAYYNAQSPDLTAGSLLKHTDPYNGWGWDNLGAFQSKVRISNLKKSAGKNEVEFSVQKSMLGNLGSQVNFALLEIDAGWNERSHFPISQQATSKFVAIQLK